MKIKKVIYYATSTSVTALITIMFLIFFALIRLDQVISVTFGIVYILTAMIINVHVDDGEENEI